MTDKVEDLRWMINRRANQLWDDLIKIDPLFMSRFDRVKVALENMIELNFMVPNMWAPDFVKTLNLSNVKWLLGKVNVEDMAYLLEKEREA